MMVQQQWQIDVVKADERRIAAVLALDRAELEGILAPQLRYVHSSGADEDKALYIERVISGHYDYRVIEVPERQFRFFGDIVVVNGVTLIDISVQGDLKHLAGRFLQIWLRSEQRWQLATFHAAAIPRS